MGAGVGVGVGIYGGLLGIGGTPRSGGAMCAAGTLGISAGTLGIGAVMVGGNCCVCGTFVAFVQSLKNGKVALTLVICCHLLVRGVRQGTDV